MCQTVIVNLGEIELTTPRQLAEHFKIPLDQLPASFGYLDIDPDVCLCQIDMDTFFQKNNISFKYDCGEYFIGMLDQVIASD